MSKSSGVITDVECFSTPVLCKMDMQKFILETEISESVREINTNPKLW